MSEFVLDASAVIAMLKREPGAERVLSIAGTAAMSSVNYCEVAAWLARGPMGEDEIERTLNVLGIDVVPFDRTAGREAGLLFRSTRGRGLSLADHACLTLARRLSVPVLTADRVWADLEPGVEVELIR